MRNAIAAVIAVVAAALVCILPHACSSLNMLNDTPVDMIKIDMMFLRNIQDQTRTKTILRNMVNMMTELGLPSIAEGVETPEQFQMLSQIGCSYFQGYLFARPVCVEEFEEQFLINGG